MQSETSIEGQRKVVTDYAKRNNFQIVHEYIDRAKSGKNDKRNQFQKMITDIQENNIAISLVLVYKLDRFARNEEMHREYERILNNNNVFLISATEEVNDSDNLGSKIMKSVSLLLNEEEVRKISQNVSRGKKVVASKGLWCGGVPPLGYDVDKGTQRLIVNKSEAKIVRTAFKLRAEGFSYSYIIDYLNKRGYRTKRGNNFGKNSLFEIFRNIKYKGVYEYNRAVQKSNDGKFNRHASKNEDEIIQIEGGCPRIVSDEIWDTVNQISKRHSGIKPKGNYLLSGLVYCKCGASMQVNRRNNHKTEYLSFFCPNHKNKLGCDAKEVNMYRLEEFVFRQLANRIFSKNVIAQFMNNFPELNQKREQLMKKHQQDLKRQIKTIDGKINNCVAEIEKGCDDIVAEVLKNRIAELSKEVKRYKRQLSKLNKNTMICPKADEIHKLKSKFVSYMQDKNRLPSNKAFLQKTIEKILVDDDKIEVIFNL